MTSIEEERRRNELLRAKENLRQEKLAKQRELKDLRRENRRLQYAPVMQGAQKVGSNAKALGRTFSSGAHAFAQQLKPAGKAVVQYGNFLAGNPSAAPQRKGTRKTYYKKVGKGRYKKVTVNRPSRAPERTHSQGSDIMRPSHDYGWW